MFYRHDRIQVITRDRVLVDREYDTPVDTHQYRFRRRLAVALAILAALGLALRL